MVRTKVAAQPCDASGVNESVFERFPARETSLGKLRILRALAIRQKRIEAPVGRTPAQAVRTTQSGKLIRVDPLYNDSKTDFGIGGKET